MERSRAVGIGGLLVMAAIGCAAGINLMRPYGFMNTYYLGVYLVVVSGVLALVCAYCCYSAISCDCERPPSFTGLQMPPPPPTPQEEQLSKDAAIIIRQMEDDIARAADEGVDDFAN